MEQKNFNCPVEVALSVIGGKYKAIILWHLQEKTLRFCELRKLVTAATPKMLVQQLRELENDGIICRTIYPVVPPKTEYFLSEYGKSLCPLLQELCSWGGFHMKEKKIQLIFSK